MINIVLTAENYAFGPIGKMLYITDLLKNTGYRLTFVGFGTSLQLAKMFPFDEIYELDTDLTESTQSLETIISGCDALISSMDVSSVNAAIRCNKPVIWIDCLFWFWDNIPEAVLGVDLYIREKSLDDSVNENKFAPLIKNLKTVGPIMGKYIKRVRNPQAMISYGGGLASHYYQVGRDTNYPFVMTDILLKYVDWSCFDKVMVATSESIVEQLKCRFTETPFEFVTLAHDKFLEEMAQSQVLLTTPGLITAQGAFNSGTPTIFIPPSNDSQYLQLDELRGLGLAHEAVGLNDFMPRLHLLHIPVEESTKLLLAQLRKLEYSLDMQMKIGNAVNELVRTRVRWANAAVINGKAYLDSLGGNGAQAAANLIITLLNSKNL